MPSGSQAITTKRMRTRRAPPRLPSPRRPVRPALPAPRAPPLRGVVPVQDKDLSSNERHTRRRRRSSSGVEDSVSSAVASRRSPLGLSASSSTVLISASFPYSRSAFVLPRDVVRGELSFTLLITRKPIVSLDDPRSTLCCQRRRDSSDRRPRRRGFLPHWRTDAATPALDEPRR